MRPFVALIRLAVAPALAVALAWPALAAPAAFDFYARGPYRPAVPRPSAVLGYDIGTFHTSYAGMERYLAAVEASASDRVRREPFGRTTEARERSLFIVSSPANLARLDAIREGNAKLADPRGVSPAEIDRLVRDLPVTVWLNYSIHGDESASFEAMMQVAYQLTAGDDSLTRALLDHCVVLINPAHNPDGHERFVTWINAHGQGNPEPWALEQQREQPWGIGGRQLHYQFDPNRDALAMSQVESRQSSREVRRWRPQVFVDHHGQTSSFFFPPTSQPTNQQLPQGDYQRWVERFGRGNAAAFDRYGWNYYVRDLFDFHAAEYWDLWPSLQGAIGMTYETDGGGNLAIRRDDETIVTMRDGAARHFVASLATLETATRLREERLRDMAKFGHESVTPATGARAYVLDPGADPLRAAALAENLMHSGVEVRWVKDAFTLKAARPTWGDPGGRPLADATKSAKDAKGTKDAPKRGAATDVELPVVTRAFPHGAFVVDLAQPGSRVARTLLEYDRSIDSTFARQELEKYERNLHRGKNTTDEFYGFYDITSWCLAVSYGVPTFATKDAPPAGVLLAEPDPNASDEATETLPDSLAIGIPFTARTSRVGPLTLRDAGGAIAFDCRGRVVGGTANTAYVWSSTTDGASRLALRLLQEDFRIATTTRPMIAGGETYPRGSFIARVERNPAALHERVAALATTCGVTVKALNSAYTESGDTGIGSESTVSLKRPRVAIVADRPVSVESYGHLWFLFERKLGVRFTAVRAAQLGQIELDRYNVVILPDGGQALARIIGDGGVGALKGWVARGGTLLCLDDASEFPTLKSVGLSSAHIVGVKVKKKGDDEDAEPTSPDSAAAEAERRPQLIPGSVFWASRDERHFLGYGFTEPRIPVLLNGNTMLTRSLEGANPFAFDRAPLAVTGWTWPETERRLGNTAYAIDEPNGSGHVILLTGPPAFRGFWRSTERLVTNAVLYAPAMH